MSSPRVTAAETATSSEMSSGFYIIESLPLKTPSNRPYHLEARMAAKRPKAHHYLKAAGHERKVAFLEARKALLRHRNARVTQVRQQAHEGRVNTQAIKAKIDETLERAGRNRAYLLAKQTKSLSEHHERVSSIVIGRGGGGGLTETVPKVTSPVRTTLEDQLREGSQRRQKLNEMPRSRLMKPSLWNSETNLALSDNASISIQRAWRRHIFVKSIRAFRKHQMTLKKAGKLEFEVLAKEMQSEALFKVTSRLLGKLKRLIVQSIDFKNPTRVFLTAYIIASHPEQTLSSMGSTELMLIQLSERMIHDFEKWIIGFETRESFGLIQALVVSWTAYYTAFESWKEADTKILIDGMVSHWIDLERLWFSVKDGVEADVEWKPRIESQQRHIQSKLARFGARAIATLQAEQVRVRAELSGVPVVVPAPIPAGEEAKLRESVKLLATSPEAYPSSQFIKKRSDSVVKASASPVLVPLPVPAVVPEPKAAAASSSYGQFLTNEMLAHEMIMDPDFQLKPNENVTPLELQVKAMAKKAFFDAVRVEFSAGQYANHLPALVTDIKETLLGMVSGTGKVATELKEFLDVELIHHQINNGVFNVRQLMGYIISKMLQLCAPMRDPVIRSISSEVDLTSAFERILGILDEMKLDLANYQLQMLKPHLKQQAVEYERGKFDAALDKGEVGLDRTVAWLKTTYTSLKAMKAARNPENVDLAENLVKFEEVYNDAFLDLITAGSPIVEETLAETFVMDSRRIFGFQNEIQAVTIVSALLMLSKNIIPSLRRNHSAIMRLKDVLFILLQDAETNIDNLTMQIVSTINETTAAEADAVTDDQTALIRNMVDKTLSNNDPVYSLLKRRIVAQIKYHLEKGLFKKDSLASHGLDAVSVELESLSVKIYILVKHNKEVYGKHYDSILKNIF